jgi:hypothetical protein
MALHAYWTHGSVGVSQFFQTSNGLDGLSVTLPEQTLAGEGEVIFPLPTPVIVNGNRARLVRFFVLYELLDKTAVGPFTILDGPNQLGKCDPQGSPGQGLSNFHVPGPSHHSGLNCLNDLINNRTRFNLEKPQQVFFGLALVVHLNMAAGGKARFTTVGADYEI